MEKVSKNTRNHPTFTHLGTAQGLFPPATARLLGKSRLWLLLWATVMCGALGQGCRRAHPSEASTEAVRLSNASVEKLYARGREHLLANRADSALLYLTLATEKYAPSLPDSSKRVAARAFCDLGYLYFSERADYSSSFSNLLRALEVAQEAGDSTLGPYIYLDIGSIYSTYDDFERASENYRRAFEAARRVGNIPLMHTVAANVVFQAVHRGEPQQADTLMASLASCGAIRAGGAAGFSQALSRLLNALKEGRTTDALQALGHARHWADSAGMDPRYGVMCQFLTARVLSGDGRPLQAADTVRAALRLPGAAAPDIAAEAYGYLSEYYAAAGRPDSALRYHTEALQVRDSVFRNQKYGLIRDMSTLHAVRQVNARLRHAEDDRRTALSALWVAVGFVAVFALLLLVIFSKNRELRQRNGYLFRRNEEAMHNQREQAMQRQIYESQIDLLRERLNRQVQSAQAADISSAAPPEKGVPGARPRYADSPLDDFDKQQLASRALAVMENAPEVTSSDFSLETLAHLVGAKPRYLSQAVNEVTGKNFNTLLGEARVRRACRQMADEEAFGNITIEGIAQGLGFRSRSNFVTVFKRVTGLSPSDYRRELRNQ